MATILTATPRTGGKTVTANLASRTQTPAQKRTSLLASLQAHAINTGVDYCVIVRDTITCEYESLTVRAVSPMSDLIDVLKGIALAGAAPYIGEERAMKIAADPSHEPLAKALEQAADRYAPKSEKTRAAFESVREEIARQVEQAVRS